MPQLLKIHLFALSCLLSSMLMAQNDTLEMAKQLSYDKKFREAETLLEPFAKQHKSDVNVQRFHAQLLNWQGKYKDAIQIYENYLSDNKEEENLLLDYGRLLFERAYYNTSKQILKKVLGLHPNEVEAMNMLSTIYFWQGKPKQSMHYLDTLDANYPGNEWAMSIRKQVMEQRAPYLQLGFEYREDSQPMKNYQSQLLIGGYRSAFFAPYLSANYALADSSGSLANSYQAVIGNKFSFAYGRSSLQLDAGLVQVMADSSFDWIASVSWRQSLSKSLQLELSYARKNYDYTISNFSNAIFYSDYKASISYSDKKSWNFQASYLLQHFDDGNDLFHTNAWILAPLVRKDKFKLMLGYAYAFSTSKENRFNTYQNKQQTIDAFDSTGKIPAIYTPYFSPQNQHIHAALLQANWKITKAVSLQISANYGCYAYAQSPYLYFDLNESKQVILVRDYYKQYYHPMELRSNLNFSLSRKMALSVNYCYREAFFYTGHHAGISLITSF